MWKLGLWQHSFFSGNICFKFLVLVLCSAGEFGYLTIYCKSLFINANKRIITMLLNFGYRWTTLNKGSTLMPPTYFEKVYFAEKCKSYRERKGQSYCRNFWKQDRKHPHFLLYPASLLISFRLNQGRFRVFFPVFFASHTDSQYRKNKSGNREKVYINRWLKCKIVCVCSSCLGNWRDDACGCWRRSSPYRTKSDFKAFCNNIWDVITRFPSLNM